jgi:hypothetical protein
VSAKNRFCYKQLATLNFFTESGKHYLEEACLPWKNNSSSWQVMSICVPTTTVVTLLVFVKFLKSIGGEYFDRE